MIYHHNLLLYLESFTKIFPRFNWIGIYKTTKFTKIIPSKFKSFTFKITQNGNLILYLSVIEK